MSTQKIFFSYSRSDSIFALKLAKDLREAGADIWIDQLDIPAGNHWDSAVEKALNSAICVLVILSPSSTGSTNVMDEVSFALEAGKKIIPVLLEDCLAPFRLRRLQRIDFTSDYNTGFSQLVTALNLTVVVGSKNEGTSAEHISIPVTTPETGPTLNPELEERENNLWEEACRVNTIASYKNYLNESLTGENKGEARLLIKQLELQQKENELEALLWQKALDENEKNLFQHYLQEYPHGNYKTLALGAIADLEKAEREEQKRIKDVERKREEEKALKEKEEREKALREKQEKEKEIQLQKEKEKQLLREKEAREKEARDKEKQLEKEARDKERQQQKEKEQLEKQEKDKQRQLQKEKEQLERQQAKEKARLEKLANPESQAAGGNQKKYGIIGGGVLLLCLVIWGIVKLTSGGGDQQAWKDALLKNDSTAFAGYQAEFPEGKYFDRAKEKIDSLYWVQKEIRDSLNAVARTQFVADSTAKASTAAKSSSTKQVETGPKSKTTTTPSKTKTKLALGQVHQGGVIISINGAGDHGLVASTKNLGDLDWDKAKNACAEYKVGSFSNWRLPTKDELNVIYTHRQLLGNFTKGLYWSSTEENKNNSWFQNFANGNQGKGNKQSTNAVRAVRNF